MRKIKTKIKIGSWITTFNPSAAQLMSSLGFNRFIEHRYKIKMVRTNLNTVNVDNYKDFQRAKKALKRGRYLKLYNNKV